jgi:arsenate reductase (thioredoxin)
MKRRVLFLCTHNAARSQMAEGLLRSLGDNQYEVFSAGTKPTSEVHPLAVEVMNEVGVDISHQKPKHMRDFAEERFHRVISVCMRTNETCDSFPEADCIQWYFDDPALAEGAHEQRLRAFRIVRQELSQRIRLWLEIDRKREDLTPRQ